MLLLGGRGEVLINNQRRKGSAKRRMKADILLMMDGNTKLKVLRVVK
jgi:hypothetical protein